MGRPTRYHDQLKLQKRRHFTRKVLFVLVLMLIACVGIVYGLLFARLFDVREVNIAGANTISGDSIISNVNMQLAHQTLGIKKGSNILLLKTSNLADVLLKDYPKLESVVIKKEYFHKLSIEIKERSNIGVWCLTKQEKCFYFDKNGVLYDSAPDTSGFLLFIVRDDRNRQIGFGDKAESQIWIDALSLARQKLTEKGFQVKELVIPEDSFDEFSVLEARGWKVLMSINTDIDAQVTAMSNFLKQKLSAERISQLQYIDLRIADRIYYK